MNRLGPIGQRIADKLTHAFKPLVLDVVDESNAHHGHAGAHPSGESHFRVRVVSPRFSGGGRVARHRMVNVVLADELHSRVHALAIEAVAPEEEFTIVELSENDGRIIALFQDVGLSATNLSGIRLFGMIQRSGPIVASGGLEFLGSGVLLRSIAVADALRGKGLGREMVTKLLEEARIGGANEAYLLTLDAIPFFAKFGFKPISRKSIPLPIAEATQFKEATCASAQAMCLRL